MGIFTNKHNVSSSFKDKLAQVLNPQEAKALEEAAKEAEAVVTEPEAEVVSDDLEQLSEEQLVEVLEEELTGYISFLLDEGFDEDEIENIILTALQDDDAGYEAEEEAE